jgi:phosphatidylinositol alpha 1,6-mannosyltransferase
VEHLRRRGHDAVVVCPGPAPESHARRPVVAVPAVSYQQFPVGVYQTDVARYGRRSGATASAAAWRWLRHLHERAAVTLVPSTAALADLTTHGSRGR